MATPTLLISTVIIGGPNAGTTVVPVQQTASAVVEDGTPPLLSGLSNTIQSIVSSSTPTSTATSTSTSSATSTSLPSSSSLASSTLTASTSASRTSPPSPSSSSDNSATTGHNLWAGTPLLIIGSICGIVMLVGWFWRRRFLRRQQGMTKSADGDGENPSDGAGGCRGGLLSLSNRGGGVGGDDDGEKAAVGSKEGGEMTRGDTADSNKTTSTNAASSVLALFQTFRNAVMGGPIAGPEFDETRDAIPYTSTNVIPNPSAHSFTPPGGEGGSARDANGMERTATTTSTILSRISGHIRPYSKWSAEDFATSDPRFSIVRPGAGGSGRSRGYKSIRESGGGAGGADGILGVGDGRWMSGGREEIDDERGWGWGSKGTVGSGRGGRAGDGIWGDATLGSLKRYRSKLKGRRTHKRVDSETSVRSPDPDGMGMGVSPSIYSEQSQDIERIKRDLDSLLADSRTGHSVYDTPLEGHGGDAEGDDHSRFMRRSSSLVETIVSSAGTITSWMGGRAGGRGRNWGGRSSPTGDVSWWRQDGIETPRTSRGDGGSGRWNEVGVWERLSGEDDEPEDTHVDGEGRYWRKAGEGERGRKGMSLDLEMQDDGRMGGTYEEEGEVVLGQHHQLPSTPWKRPSLTLFTGGNSRETLSPSKSTRTKGGGGSDGGFSGLTRSIKRYVLTDDGAASPCRTLTPSDLGSGQHEGGGQGDREGEGEVDRTPSIKLVSTPSPAERQATLPPSLLPGANSLSMFVTRSVGSGPLSPPIHPHLFFADQHNQSRDVYPNSFVPTSEEDVVPHPEPPQSQAQLNGSSSAMFNSLSGIAASMVFVPTSIDRIAGAFNDLGNHISGNKLASEDERNAASYTALPPRSPRRKAAPSLPAQDLTPKRRHAIRNNASSSAATDEESSVGMSRGLSQGAGSTSLEGQASSSGSASDHGSSSGSGSGSGSASGSEVGSSTMSPTTGSLRKKKVGNGAGVGGVKSPAQKRRERELAHQKVEEIVSDALEMAKARRSGSEQEAS